MYRSFTLVIALLVGAITFTTNAREERVLTTGWKFAHGHLDSLETEWQNVRVPHDWAIYGPFDRANDLQVVAVEQNGEREETVKTARTGGLPFIGKGVYRTSFDLDAVNGKNVVLVFDGAMSHAHVNVNGKEVGYWPYGYNSFYLDVTDAVKVGSNDLIVELENFEQASRWYPGAGLYRNVRLIVTDRVHVPTWGTYLTTPNVTDSVASVRLETTIVGMSEREVVTVVTDILAPDGTIVATSSSKYVARGQKFVQNFLVNNPQLWSPASPHLYKARTRLVQDGEEKDCYTTTFGIRKLEYVPEKGFFLNGQVTKFRGVCNHHDLGPLGAAVNASVIRYRLELLKDMGVNAIRTSHNMPSPELVSLCDEMGIMLMIEPFDDWGFHPKTPNGYGASFDEWWERDITNMVQHYRNSPSVVLWSIGNEVTSQWGEPGMRELTQLQNLVHFLDPTRPVTCGMDQIGSILDNGFAAALDIPGFNYKPQYYDRAYEILPQRLILGSETASTVSSRGIYHFPITYAEHNQVLHPDNQSSGYDNEACSWSNTPDIDFAMDEDREYVIGQFVWTGFDYLGEPSPYDTDAWPSHSSMFGIIDLASLPKDRFYLYRSQWNEQSPTLHILPHWNWEGREGDTIPVYVYTSYPKVELFLNGKSLGERTFNDSTLYNRFRLMWNHVVYERGELKAVAYDESGKAVEEAVVRTASKPHHLVLSVNCESLAVGGNDMAIITVRVADKDGNIVPTDTRLIKFAVEGAGTFEAAANGDATCLMPFQNPEMRLFSGAATAIIRSGESTGTIRFTAKAKGLQSATIELPVK